MVVRKIQFHAFLLVSCSLLDYRWHTLCVFNNLPSVHVGLHVQIFLLYKDINHTELEAKVVTSS